jgi:hypothetical protein
MKLNLAHAAWSVLCVYSTVMAFGSVSWSWMKEAPVTAKVAMVIVCIASYVGYVLWQIQDHRENGKCDDGGPRHNWQPDGSCSRCPARKESS